MTDSTEASPSEPIEQVKGEDRSIKIEKLDVNLVVKSESADIGNCLKQEDNSALFEAMKSRSL